MENLPNPPSAEVIIAAVKRLPLPELEQLVDQVIAIRAERRALRRVAAYHPQPCRQTFRLRITPEVAEV